MSTLPAEVFFCGLSEVPTLTDLQTLLMLCDVLHRIPLYASSALEISSTLSIIRARILSARGTVRAQLSPDEERIRCAVHREDRAALLAIESRSLPQDEARFLLSRWKEVCAYIAAGENVFGDDLTLATWLGVAIIRNLDLELVGEMSNADIIMIDTQRLRVIAIIAAGLQTDGFEFGEERDRMRAILHELVSIGGFHYEQPLPQPRVVDPQTRREAVLSLYPAVDLSTLGPDERQCRLCHEEFGAQFTDVAPCMPRRSRCCPPALVGDTCLITWMINEENTCPLSRCDHREALIELLGARGESVRDDLLVPHPNSPQSQQDDVEEELNQLCMPRATHNVRAKHARNSPARRDAMRYETYNQEYYQVIHSGRSIAPNTAKAPQGRINWVCIDKRYSRQNRYLRELGYASSP